MIQSKDIERYWGEGYTIVRGAFTKEEASSWRELALAATDHAGDVLSHPGLSGVLLHKSVLGAVGDILGAQPVYFGDSGVRIGTQGRGYHKDNADRDDPKAPDWCDPYTLCRVGIYLQDHTRYSGGLNVRAGSHKTVSLKRGRTVYMDTAMGDMVIWNLRTSHSANGVILRRARKLHIPPDIVRFTPSFLIEETADERVAIFMTFGVHDAHLERYLCYVKTRAYMIDLWKASPWSESVRATAASRAVQLRDVWAEVRDENSLGQSKGWAAIPY